VGVRELILVRHGESQGNVAAAAAYADGLEVIEVDERDADVELSATGADQAKALGDALSGMSGDERPDVVWCSPYVRALQTARIGLETAGLDLSIRVDERLRDRELGVLDRLTFRGVQARHPEEAELRKRLGKFYHRPSGGESWADVALRLRSVLADLDRVEDGRRVLVVCHDAVVMLIRYICEQMSEAEVLDTESEPVLNVSITRLAQDPDGRSWVLTGFNDVSHLHDEPTPVTQHPGQRDA
jgi:2,3-bisphosphoglycerate-dependent phosphoglycerate mutase